MSNKQIDNQDLEKEADLIDEFGEKVDSGSSDSIYEEFDGTDDEIDPEMKESETYEASDTEQQGDDIPDAFDEQISSDVPPMANSRSESAHPRHTKKSGKKKLVTAIALGLFSTIGAGGFLLATGVISTGGQIDVARVTMASPDSHLPSVEQSSSNADVRQSNNSSAIDIDDFLGIPTSNTSTDQLENASEVDDSNLLHSDQPNVNNPEYSVGDDHRLKIQTDNSISSIVESMVGQMDEIAVRVSRFESKLSDGMSEVDQRIVNIETRMETALAEIENMIASGVSSVQPATPRSSSSRKLPLSDVNGVHTVVSGDTVTNIAGRYGLSVSELIRNNGISDPDFIPIGMSLRVDGVSASEDVIKRISALTRTPSNTKKKPARSTQDVIAQPERLVSVNQDAGGTVSGWSIAGMSPERVVLVNGGGVFITARIGDTISALGEITSINMSNGTVVTSAGVISN